MIRYGRKVKNNADTHFLYSNTALINKRVEVERTHFLFIPGFLALVGEIRRGTVVRWLRGIE